MLMGRSGISSERSSKVIEVSYETIAIFLIVMLLFGYTIYRMVGLEDKIREVNENVIKELEDIKKELVDIDIKVNYLSESDSKTWNYVKDVEKDVKEKIDDISFKLEDLSRRTIKTPTLKILQDFLEEDDTNEYQYVENRFECTDFANRFVSNFLKKGYYSCVSYILFSDSAHAIVAVNTSDYGVVYVEPQEDKIIYDLRVGDNYCEKLGWDCYARIYRIVDCFNFGR